MANSNGRLFAATAFLGGMMTALAFLGLAGNSDAAALGEALRYFSAEDIARGRSHFAWGIVPSLAYRLLALGLLLFFAVKHRAIADFFEKKILRPSLRTALYVIMVLAAMEVLAFPFAVVSGFVRKKMFGLLTADFPLWLYRYLASKAIGVLVAAAIIVLFLLIAGKIRRYRIILPALFLALSLAGVFLYPRVVSPLFYSARPLPDGALKTGISGMLERSGTTVGGIHVIDESRYSKHGNAYFTGWGAFREIYLYDTVLDGHDDGEVCAIVAHELCHYREEHVLIGLFLGAVGLFFGLFALDRLCLFLFGEGLAGASRSGKVPHIILAFSMLLFAARPAINGISRMMERRCDAYAVELTENGAAFVEMERKLALKNRGNILPNPVFQWYYGTHPTVMERIRAGEGRPSAGAIVPAEGHDRPGGTRKSTLPERPPH